MAVSSRTSLRVVAREHPLHRLRKGEQDDSDRYRDKAEIARWKERDPIELLTARMRADGELSDDGLKALHREIDDELQRAVAGADAGPLEPIEDLTRFVYAEQS